MATPRKNPSSYPPEYAEAIRRAVENGWVTINFLRAGGAERFRKSLYAFRESLESNPEHDVELLLISRQMTVSVYENSCSISVPKLPDLGDFQ